MGGTADEYVVAEDRPGGGHGEVALAEVEDVGAGRVGDIGAVVDREQSAVTGAGVGEDLEVLELFGGLHALVAELDDVHAVGEDGVQEVGEVALALAGVGAEVDAGVGEVGAWGVGHGFPRGWVALRAGGLVGGTLCRAWRHVGSGSGGSRRSRSGVPRGAWG